MPEPSALAVFAVASLALAVVPGPAVIYIVTQSVGQGRRAGIVSAFGIAVGGLVHVLAATVGLSALLASSAGLFAAVKYAGAAYLVYLGIRRLLGRDEPVLAGAPGGRPTWMLFRRGVVVNVLNPKTALFFLAFLPQFVDPDRGAAGLQALALGLLFVLIALASDSIYALLAGTAGAWLRDRGRFLRIHRYVSGGVFVGLGATAALSSAHD